MRCDACKHWKDTDEWDVQAGGLRKCERALPKWKIEDAIPEAIRSGKYGFEGDDDPETAAYKAAAEGVFAAARVAVNDGSQYCAELLTRPDFGCVLHEPI